MIYFEPCFRPRGKTHGAFLYLFNRKRKAFFFLILSCLLSANMYAQSETTSRQRFTLSGYIREKGTGEFLIGASVAVPKFKTGTVTNAYGFFSITLPSDSFQLVITYIGYQPKAYDIVLDKDIELNTEMEEATTLKEVEVKASRTHAKISETVRMSVIEIPVEQIKDIPALFGEKDVLKVIQLLPGVQKGGEGNSGLYVRGGGPDQNLIILDDATVYNAYHLFGFFSLFNGDALRSVELTKGGFPARYGGRLSSVLDMNMKEGNKESFHGNVGIGLVSSRLTLEGPIVKGKSSFLVSGRRTYIDALTRPFITSNGQDGGYYFYDLNVKANYELSNKDRLFVSGYFGRDKFWAENSRDGSNSYEAGIAWGNATATLRWNHLFNNKVFTNASFIFSDYRFTNSYENKFDGSAFKLEYQSGVQDFGLKYDVDYRPSPAHTIKAGVVSTYHVFTPSAKVMRDDFTGTNTSERTEIGAFDNAVYIEDEIRIGTRYKVNPGLRLSHFAPKNANYFRIEPRINMSYMIASDLSVKASYAEMNQYIHLLSNTGIGLPTDLWVPSTDLVKPQRSRQVALGLAKDINNPELTLSIEGYYKKSDRVIAYKEGASFLEVDQGQGTQSNGRYNWENNVLSGQGWSYGAEFLIQKKAGRFTGWIGYTLSWTQLQFDGLNEGKKFYARYDRRHDLSVVGIFKVVKEEPGKNGVTLAGTFVYGTGNAITLPVAEYNAPIHQPTPGSFPENGSISEYTGRNEFRMGSYHRMDFSVQVHKKNPKTVRTWEFSVYNLYNRQNPFFYYIEYNNSGKGQLKQISLFPIIPSISWNLKF